MPDVQVKSAKLASLPDHTEALLLSFLSESKEGTQVFGLVKLSGKKHAYREHLLAVIHEALLEFADSITRQVNTARRFEQFIESLKEQILDVVSGDRRIPISDMHAVIGVVQDRHVLLAGVGNLLAIFMHKTAKQRYVIYQLDQYFQESEAPTWDTIFSSVLDGELHAGDIFYTATRIPPRAISTSELQDILTTLPPSGSLKRIQQYVGINDAYGGVCFRVAEIKEGKPKKLNPIASIEQFEHTKEATSKVLGEQSPDVGSFLERISNPLIKKLSSPGTKGTKSTARRALGITIKVAVIILTFLAHALKWLGTMISAVAKFAMRHLNKNNEEAFVNKAKGGVQSMRDWPRRNKIIFGVTIGILAALILSVVLLNRDAKDREAGRKTDELVAHIEEKTNAAEASLIYNDVAQAQTLLNEALALVNTLPQDGAAGEEATRLRAQIDAVFATIRGEVHVDANVVATAPEALGVITEAGGTIYAFGTSNAYTLQDGALTASGTINAAIAATGEGADILFLDNAGLARFSTVAGTATSVVSGVSSFAPAQGLQMYNGTLYVLNARNNQIVRMRPQGASYEAGTPWIIDRQSDLTTARSLAIDGNVYILTESGVVQFASGRETAFRATIDPTLQNPINIWTSVDSQYLYILEPSAQRIVVLNKDGSLHKQYVSPALASATGMIIQESAGTILFSAGDTIYSIAIK